MAQQAVAHYAISIRLACSAFSISETCYRYQTKLSDDNTLIEEQLIELTEENTDWALVCVSLIYVMLKIMFEMRSTPPQGVFIVFTVN